MFHAMTLVHKFCNCHSYYLLQAKKSFTVNKFVNLQIHKFGIIFLGNYLNVFPKA